MRTAAILLSRCNSCRRDFFKDRTVYYTSRLISKLVPRGYKGNTYELPEVYFIGILNFVLDQSAPDQYFYDVALCDRQSKGQFYDKLGYKLLVLPNFRKEQADLESAMDKWFYLFRYITELKDMPKFLDSRVFGLIFDIGKVANLTATDMKLYESSLKNKRDAESVRITAMRMGHEEGLREGRREGKREEAIAIAREMKKDGLSIEQIVKFTKLTIKEIEELK